MLVRDVFSQDYVEVIDVNYSDFSLSLSLDSRIMMLRAKYRLLLKGGVI